MKREWIGDDLKLRSSMTLFVIAASEYEVFRKVLFGHYHDNRNMNDREIMLYEQIIRIR